MNETDLLQQTNERIGVIGPGRKIILFICGFLTVLLVAPAPSAQHRIKEFSIESKVLKESRKYYVSVPADYETSRDRYPVLLVLYADSDQFSESISIARELSEKNESPKLIVVGVTVDGMRDLTPTQAADYGPTSGGAARFIEFLNTELVPEVDRKHRTLPKRIFSSHSIGGTLGIFTLLSNPDLFYAYLVSSPYFLYDREKRFLLNNAGALLSRRKETSNYLYICVGDEPGLKKEIDEFFGILKNSNTSGLMWDYDHMPEESHRTISPRALNDGLPRLFSKNFRPSR